VRVILGSSGKLTAQIKNGAPYGLFMSADMAYPEALYREGLAASKPQHYARGALALFTTRTLDLGEGIRLLESDGIKRLAIANPKTAPYGKAAMEAIKKSGLYEKVKSKFVYGESISQTVAYAVTAADIGLIAASSLYSPHMKQYKKGAHWTLVDPSLYTPIEQGIVLLKSGADNPEYKAFYDFILSPQARKIFKKYGYLE
jgi:molybdate transport system substrate-binding protein